MEQLFPKTYYGNGLEGTYIITIYKKGKKEGLQSTYSQSNNKLLCSNEYKKNKLITKTVFETTPDSKTEFKGSYKKENPYNGEFVTRKAKIIQIDFLEKGKLHKAIFIHKNGQDTLILKNQKPFNGTQIRFIKDNLFHDTYQQGTLTKVSFSGYEVNYFPNGFETTKSCKDCMIHKVEFLNKNKTSGIVTFGKNRTEDFIRFSDGKMIEMNIQERGYDREILNWKIKNSKPTITFLSRKGDIKNQIRSNFQWNFETIYFDLIDLDKKLFENGKVLYFLLEEKKPFAFLDIVNDKKLNGIEIEQDNDGFFYLEKIENGDTILDKEKITLEEVLKICKENQ